MSENLQTPSVMMHSFKINIKESQQSPLDANYDKSMQNPLDPYLLTRETPSKDDSVSMLGISRPPAPAFN